MVEVEVESERVEGIEERFRGCKSTRTTCTLDNDSVSLFTKGRSFIFISFLKMLSQWAVDKRVNSQSGSSSGIIQKCIDSMEFGMLRWGVSFVV